MIRFENRLLVPLEIIPQIHSELRIIVPKSSPNTYRSSSSDPCSKSKDQKFCRILFIIAGFLLENPHRFLQKILQSVLQTFFSKDSTRNSINFSFLQQLFHEFLLKLFQNYSEISPTVFFSRNSSCFLKKFLKISLQLLP